MNAREFEEFVRAAWTSTTAPLTDEHLQRMSGLPRADVEHLARGLMRKGVVDMEVTSTGAIAWCVRGVARAPAAEATPAAPPPPPPQGPASAEPPRATPLAVKAASPPPVAGEVAKPVEVAKPEAKFTGITVPGFGWKLGFSADPDRKSILLSGGASLLFGPFGWGYAGAWKEVLPAIAIYVGAIALFPKFLIATLLGVVHPACGVVGMIYAFKHNRAKVRTPLLLVDRPPTVEAAGVTVEKLPGGRDGTT